ncbi:bromodomain-containing protein 4-like isoform X2 [Panicum virgatum]|uniref:bromodomain-containing protein 4-like isoform X2 n=1 Tax=Panicum virgatum TaxID=38727 RepID=UPI0019D5BD5D|nr:bromodomain-containing protein 4-like isoform X2 [Panicum virgatum]
MASSLNSNAAQQQAPGFAAAAEKQGAAMAAPPSPRGAPGFAVVPQGGAPASPQGPPGFWVAPQQSAPAPSQVAHVVAPPQGATVMASQQQHFAHVMVPGSQQCMQMAVQPASMAMMMASMSQQAQAQAMAAHQPAQGMAPSQSLPTYLLSMMQMQQAQAGHMMETPPLPLGPPPLVQQQQQQPPPPPPSSHADPTMTAQPPLPLGPPPVMLQQQPAQGAPVMMAQPPLPFSSPSVMLQQNPQVNQMMMGQAQLSSLPCKRQRVDQYGNPYGQHMTGHQQETIFNAAMGQSFGPNLQHEFPSFGASMPSSLPKDATSTVYVDGLPTNCTRREVAHIFRQYMGFREVRLVNKGSNRHAICFVDFATPTHAFLAMRTLQVLSLSSHELTWWVLVTKLFYTILLF